MKLVDGQAIYGLWLRDVKRFLRTPARITDSLAMPLLFLVFVGFGFQSAAIPGLPRRSSKYLADANPLTSGVDGLRPAWSGRRRFPSWSISVPSSYRRL